MARGRKARRRKPPLPELDPDAGAGVRKQLDRAAGYDSEAAEADLTHAFELGSAEALLARIRVVARERIRRDRRRVEDADLKRLLAYLDEHLFDPGLSLSGIRRSGAFRATTFDAFRTELRRRPKEYVRDRKMEAALRLLASTNLEIWRIARFAGFSSTAAFDKAFTAWAGRTPIDHRKRSKSGAVPEGPRVAAVHTDAFWWKAILGALDLEQAGRLFAWLRSLLPADAELTAAGRKPRWRLLIRGTEYEELVADMVSRAVRAFSPAERELAREAICCDSPELSSYEPAAAVDCLKKASAETFRRIAEDRAGAGPLVGRLLDGVGEHLLEPGFNATRLLAAAGLTSGPIEAAFHAETDQSALDYLLKCRLEIASGLLLHTNLQVADVAHLTGFSDRFHLNRAVKRWLGMPPREIRAKWRQVVARAGRPTEELLSRRFWLALRKGQAAGRQVVAALRYFFRVYPQAAGAMGVPTRGVADAEVGVNRRLEQALWELLEALPPAKQRHFVRHVIRCFSPELFHYLGEMSLEVGRRGRVQRGVETAELALELLEGSAEELGSRLPGLRALGLARLANAHRLAGDFGEAARMFAAVEVKWAACPEQDGPVKAEILFLKASLFLYRRQFDRARELLTTAVDLCRKARSSRLLAQCLIQRANVNGYAGDPHRALSDLCAARFELADTDEPRLTLVVDTNLATFSALAGSLDEAEEALARAKRLADRLGDRQAFHHQQWVRGLVSCGRSDLGGAASLYQDARAGFIRLGQPGYAAMAALELAMLRHQQGRFAEVVALAAEVVPVFEHFRQVPGVMAALKLVQEAVARNRVTMEVLESAREQLHALWRDPTVDLADVAE
ncbi:MAG: AraC family transcriptional regulator [bacterium]|nr:AraC family transcriptional regulator [bacterium]